MEPRFSDGLMWEAAKQIINVKNIASMAIVSHKDCGLDYSPMSQNGAFPCQEAC